MTDAAATRADPALKLDALLGLPRHIERRLRHVGEGRDLAVVMSSRARFELGRAVIRPTTLDLADLDRSYYLRGASRTARALAAFVGDNGFRRVAFIGGSKAGFGALMLSRELAARLPSVVFSAITFSPQTRLWPRNGNLDFPSYAALLEQAAESPRLMSALRRFGDQRRPMTARNLRWLVHYGTKNDSDAREAEGLRGANVRLVGFPMRSHSTLLPVICSGQAQGQIALLVRSYYGAKASDEDIAFNLLTGDQEELVREIMDTLPTPPIGDVISESFEGLARAGLWRRVTARLGVSAA